MRNFSESSTGCGGVRGHSTASRGDTRCTLSNDEARYGRHNARSRNSSGVSKVQDVNPQHVQQAIHGFGAEAATWIQKLRHVGLLKTGLAREPGSG